MSLLYLTNQTTNTSDPIGPLRSRLTDDYPVNIRLFLWGDFGGGSVEIEVQMPDDSWATFPELTFTAATAQDIHLFEQALIRVNVIGGTAINVMLDN